MPREILVDWTTSRGPGQVSVFMFSDTVPVADQRNAIGAFLTDADGILSTTTSWVVRTTGRELNDGTGQLEGVWNESTGHSGLGAQVQEQMSDATQVLVRWKTALIINGRFLQGRTFLPGVAVTAAVDGNLGDGARDTVLTAAQNLVDDAVQLSVWHRPVAGAGGARTTVIGTDVWREFAVLRRRRG